jgi:hypothetical protein
LKQVGRKDRLVEDAPLQCERTTPEQGGDHPADQSEHLVIGIHEQAGVVMRPDRGEQIVRGGGTILVPGIIDREEHGQRVFEVANCERRPRLLA